MRVVKLNDVKFGEFFETFPILFNMLFYKFADSSGGKKVFLPQS